MTTVCLCALDEAITALLQNKDSDNYRDWLNARINLPIIEKPCFIYIPKVGKTLSKFYALLRSLKREHYRDISYYANKLLSDGVPAEEIIEALVVGNDVPRVYAPRVYATTYDVSAACRKRLADDPVFKALALADTTTLRDINAYIKAQLTAEEAAQFIGDTLTVEAFEAARQELKQKGLPLASEASASEASLSNPANFKPQGAAAPFKPRRYISKSKTISTNL
jgi:hypothetical protein